MGIWWNREGALENGEREKGKRGNYKRNGVGYSQHQLLRFFRFLLGQNLSSFWYAWHRQPSKMEQMQE